MKFKDITTFTRPAHYHVDVSLPDLKEYIDHKVECGLQLNPDFQRGHVWTEEQQIAYVEYMLRGGTSGREIYFNMPNLDWSNETDFVCVDGLQRITACLRFLNNEIRAFGTMYEDFEGRIDHQVGLSIWVNILETRREVLVWYLEMNSGGTPHTDTELEKIKRMIEEI